jgi:hypothetical protein
VLQRKESVSKQSYSEEQDLMAGWRNKNKGEVLVYRKGGVSRGWPKKRRKRSFRLKFYRNCVWIALLVGMNVSMRVAVEL